jgi:hypothetical protein
VAGNFDPAAGGLPDVGLNLAGAKFVQERRRPRKSAWTRCVRRGGGKRGCRGGAGRRRGRCGAYGEEGLAAFRLAASALHPYFLTMLAKLTSKNQLTLPKAAVEALGAVSHFQVEVDGDRLVLTPARVGEAAAVREKLAALGLGEGDVADAVGWARRRGAGRG